MMILSVGCVGAPSTDTVPCVADADWRSVGTMPSGEGGAVVRVNEGWLHVGGWSSTTGVQAGVRASADGAEWWRVGQLPRATQHHAITTDGRDLWLLGGDTGAGGTTLDQILRSSDGGATWVEDGTMPAARSGFGFASLEDGGIIVGGFSDLNTFEVSSEVWRARRTNEGWTFEALAPLPEPRAWAAVVAVDGRVVAAGGFDGTAESASVWQYDLEADTWTAVEDLPASTLRSAVTSAGGKVFLVGGQGARAQRRVLVGQGDPIVFTAGVRLPEGRFSGVAWVNGVDLMYARGFATAGEFDTVGEVLALTVCSISE